MNQRKVLASQMVGLCKISLMNIITKSRNPSVLVFILVFKLRTELPGKCVSVGETIVKMKSSLQITPWLFSSSPQRMGLTSQLVEQGFLSLALWYPNFWKQGGDTSATLPSQRLTAVASFKTRKRSPLSHNSTFSSSAQMQAARWLFIKGRQPKVHTVLNTVSARESQAT